MAERVTFKQAFGDFRDMLVGASPIYLLIAATFTILWFIGAVG